MAAAAKLLRAHLLSLASVSSSLAAAPRGALQVDVLSSTYTIAEEARGREFLGYGVNPSAGTYRLLHDYPEPQRSEILDYMFKVRRALCTPLTRCATLDRHPPPPRSCGCFRCATAIAPPPPPSGRFLYNPIAAAYGPLSFAQSDLTLPPPPPPSSPPPPPPPP
eukprot:SAG22_NODE_2126_length_2972_cov_2.751479_2_plen_163_part_01